MKVKLKKSGLIRLNQLKPNKQEIVVHLNNILINKKSKKIEALHVLFKV